MYTSWCTTSVASIVRLGRPDSGPGMLNVTSPPRQCDFAKTKRGFSCQLCPTISAHSESGRTRQESTLPQVPDEFQLTNTEHTFCFPRFLSHHAKNGRSEGGNADSDTKSARGD